MEGRESLRSGELPQGIIELGVDMSRASEYKDAQGNYKNPYFPDAELTPDIFWAYFTPAVQALRELNVDTPAEASARFELLIKLLGAGEIIPSREVALYGYDPVTFVGVCELDGFKWFPSFGEPNVFPQAVGAPGFPQYDADHPPVRSFPISLKASKWPPKVKPTQSPTEVPKLLVGNSMGGGFYGAGPGASQFTVTPGAPYTAADGRTVYAYVSTGFLGSGWSCYFSVVPAK